MKYGNRVKKNSMLIALAVILTILLCTVTVPAAEYFTTDGGVSVIPVFANTGTADTAMGTPVQGALIYSTSDGGIMYYDGSAWVSIESLADGTAANNTLRWNGSNWVESTALTNDGTDITATGDVAVNGGDITTTATALNMDVADTGTIALRDGTNTLLSVADNGTTGNVTSTGTLTASGGSITTGSDGTDGSLVIYSEQGATDYSYTINPHAAATQNVTLTLPADDGTVDQILQTDGSGNLSWGSAGGGIYSGDGTAPSDVDVTVTDNIDFDSGTLFIDGTNNRVGIGTTSPDTALQINTDSGGSGGNLRLRRTNGTGEVGMSLFPHATESTDSWYLSVGSWSNDGDFIVGSNSGGGPVFAIEDTTGAVGIGDTTPDGKLEVRQTAAADIFNLYDNTTNVFTVLDGGNVGIGTNTPATKVEIEGRNPVLFLSDTEWNSTGDYGELRFGDTGHYLRGEYGVGLQYNSNAHTFTGDLNADSNTLFVDASADSVGIGTSTVPHGSVGFAKLAIEGANGNANGPHVQYTTASDDFPLSQQLYWTHDNMGIMFDAYFDGTWRSSDASSNFSVYKSSGLLRFQYDSGIAAGSPITFNDGMVMNTSGDVGIGTTSPTQPLEVNGAIQAGSPGTDGALRIYSEEGATDQVVVFQPHADMTQDTTYTLPADDGTSGQVLSTDGSGALSWANATVDTNLGGNDQTLTGARTVTMGANNLSFTSTGGDLDVDSNTLFVDASADRVGVNTSAPDTALHVRTDSGGSGGHLRLQRESTDGEVGLGLFPYAGAATNAWLIAAGAWGNTDDLLITQNGSDGITLENTTGYVGIGDNTPDGRLEVRNDSTEDILNLYDSTTNVFSVLDGGNVGIGTGAPATRLEVEGRNPVLFLSDTEWNSTGDYGEVRFGDANHYIRGEFGVGLQYNSTEHRFTGGDVWADADTTFFVDASADNVGFGISTPVNKVDIAGATRSGTHPTGRPLYVSGNIGQMDNGIEFLHSNSTSGVGIGWDGIYRAGTNANSDLQIHAKGTGNVIVGAFDFQVDTNVLFVDATNDTAGIGDTTPDGKLEVRQTATADIFNLYDNTTNVLTVLDGGNVGIGDTTPTATLVVAEPNAGLFAEGENLRINNDSVAANASILGITTDDTGAVGRYFIGMKSNVDTVWDNEFLFHTNGNAQADGSWSGGGADYAEWFMAEEEISTSALVGLNVATGKVREWQEGDPLIGVQSINPGFIGNNIEAENSEEDMLNMGYALVGLVGQLDVSSPVLERNGAVYTPDGEQFIGYRLSDGKVFLNRDGGAIQELSQQVDQLKSENEALKTEVSKITTLQGKLAQLQARIEQFENHKP